MQAEQELLQRLQRNTHGVIAVTSTVRAARSLRQRYNQWQRSTGRQGWHVPLILSWDAWLDTLWDAAILSGMEAHVLLTREQEAELWRQIISRDEIAASILSVEGLVEQAQRTWHAMVQYRISVQSVHSDDSIDAASFARWATNLETVCTKKSYLSRSQLELALASVVPSGRLDLPKEMYLIGFDRTTPLQEFFLNTLRACKCDVHPVAIQSKSNTAAPSVVYARTQEEEIGHLASWVRHALLKNPNQRIGVIVSDQSGLHDSIDATFRRILTPSSMDVRTSSTNLPYEFSMGIPMNRMEPIRTALSLLRWLNEALPAEEVSWLMTQGTFSSQAIDDRAMLDSRFRERKHRVGELVSLRSFWNWISSAARSDKSFGLRQAVGRFITTAGGYDLARKRSYADWREIIEDLLSKAEWRLLRASNSSEYQLLQRWNTLLNELSSLNSIVDREAFPIVLKRLQHFAASMLFTLEAKNAPVQILGASESTGLEFDAIWWLDATAESWPPRGHALPFLPWRIQRISHMPYADPEEDAAFALRATQRILASAGTVIVSFALQQRDPSTASSHTPSPEIALSQVIRTVLVDTPLVPIETFVAELRDNTLNDDSHTSLFAGGPLAADGHPVLHPVDVELAVSRRLSPVSGGVTFLKHQAACPFRAFAELRLGTRPLAETGLGLSPAEQGTLVHKVLEKFWARITSQKELLQRTEDDWRQILKESIRAALEQFIGLPEETWQSALLEIEAERIEGRLMEWLAIEKLRPDFTVEKREAVLKDAQLGGVTFDCRMDRIDSVEQGLVLIDYKTGSVDAKSCGGDRPDEPQLPAYAALLPTLYSAGEPLVGMAFAGLSSGQVGFKVIDALPEIFSGAAQGSGNGHAGRSLGEMAQQQEIWRETLTRLADAFQKGIAVVDPKYGDTTCKYCALALLCRVQETEKRWMRLGDESEVIDMEGAAGVAHV